MFIGDSYRVPGKVKVTYWLIVINILSFIAVHYRMDEAKVFLVGGIVPVEWFDSVVPLSAMRPPEILSMFWSFFLHGSWLHVLQNMMFLFFLGPNLEATMGRVNFTFFYFSCGGAGALGQVLYNVSSTAPIIGASGAIAGLLGAYLILFKDHFIRIDLGRHAHRDLIFPIYIVILVWLFLQVLHGVLPLIFRPRETLQPIAYFAHIAGFICGFFLASGMQDRGNKFHSRFRVFKGGKNRGF